LAVGDRDDGVVERSLDVGDAVGDDALDLLLGLVGRLVHWASLLLDGLARALAGPGIGAGALAAHRQAAAVAQAAVAAQVHQPLDRHADLTTQVAFDRVLGHLGADALDFRLGQVANLGRRGDARRLANQLRPRAADTKDTLQAHPD